MKIGIIAILCTICSLITSCKNDFDELKAMEIVSLSAEDLRLFDELYSYVQEDLWTIREQVKPLHFSSDTTLLGSNSYYLNQIDSSKYSSIMKKLAAHGVFSNNIECSPTGLVAFRLKHMSDIKWDDYNDTHIHELVYGFDEKEYGYTKMKVVFDSIIKHDVRYVYFTTKTGH